MLATTALRKLTISKERTHLPRARRNNIFQPVRVYGFTSVWEMDFAHERSCISSSCTVCGITSLCLAN